MFELLDEIRDKIWSRYSGSLQDLLQEQQRSSGDDDSELPFPDRLDF